MNSPNFRRVGRHRVCVDDLEQPETDLLAADEVGNMEVLLAAFREVVEADLL